MPIEHKERMEEQTEEQRSAKENRKLKSQGLYPCDRCGDKDYADHTGLCPDCQDLMTCDNCGTHGDTWHNSSDELQCDNCGHSEGE